MKRPVKLLLYSLIFIFLLLQLYPRHNENRSSEIPSTDIAVVHAIPANVSNILKRSCYDCHSNHTNYPWYANIQPISWWLADHIEEGKSELNFSVFGKYQLRRRFHKLEEIEEMISQDLMPLKSYTNIHRSAKLSATERKEISAWTTDLRDSLRLSYPADSFKRKR